MMSGKLWKEGLQREVDLGKLSEGEAKVYAEIMSMFDFMMKEAETSDSAESAIKRFALFLKDLDDFGLSDNRYAYLYRAAFDTYVRELVNIIIRERVGPELERKRGQEE